MNGEIIMKTLFENGESLLEQKREEFNESIKEALTKRDGLLNEFEEENATKNDFVKKLKEHEELIEKYKKEEIQVKKELETLLVAEEFSINGTFEEKRLRLVEINKCIANTTYFKEEIQNRLKSLENHLASLQRRLEVAGSLIPENPYEIMGRIALGDDKKAAEMKEMHKVIHVLSQNLRVGVDFELIDSKKNFELSVIDIETKTPTIDFGAKVLAANTVLIRQDVEDWHGEIQDTKDVMVPVLNIKSRGELTKMFSPYEKNDLHIQTVTDINGLKYIKDIFIKNTYATDDKESYIRIGTKDITSYSHQVDVYTKGLVIEFSEHPFIF